MSLAAAMPCPASGSTCRRPGTGTAGRRQRAQIPRDVAFQTKTELAKDMIGGHAAAGVPFAWVAGDEVYGRASKLRGACQQAGKGYVFAVPSSFQVRLPSGGKIPVAALARLIPAAAWETRSCGPGCKGQGRG
jgi:SRSO17 transposase